MLTLGPTLGGVSDALGIAPLLPFLQHPAQDEALSGMLLSWGLSFPFWSPFLGNKLALDVIMSNESKSPHGLGQ